ncbi:E3 SUMO-protein ligase Su(var)2-10 isoform X3 [Arctopsyche grandis]|uniref:E3 SUMO-protein ligase Su(var)2-10 isoform X3 n=1 Tax=Arctopsyche grandis TaxID=121162 RepID=UPI00406D6EF5
MSRYYDFNNGISWQNQSLAGAGVGVGVGGSQKENPRAPPQAPIYQHPSHQAYSPRTNSLYPQSMYHQYQAGKPQINPSIPTYPVLPDVKLKKLPFYDVLAEILKPSSLLPSTAQRMQEAMFSFYLTPQQATDIATGRDILGVSNKIENIVQVQLRFCLVETSCEQEDYFPPNCAVKVNGKMCPLPTPIPTNKPGVEPKRPPRPVNVTSLLKFSPTVINAMTVTWATDFTRNHALSVTLVRKLTSAQLLTRLKNKGTKHSDYTRSLIKEKLREDLDCEIATTSLRVSLVCPLGKMRMVCPCRPATCLHLQCFDASLFLQMNERKPTWVCPVCDKPALYDNLVVDGYFQDVLNSTRLGSDCCEVQLHKDGSWSAHISKKDDEISAQPIQEHKLKIEVISDDLEVIPLSDGSNSSTGPPAKKIALSSEASRSNTPVKAQVVDLTSDSEDELPLRKKVAQPADSTLVHAESSSTAHIKYNDASGSYAAGTGVSSSGYQSPGPVISSPTTNAAPIISLDSPSPPPAPTSPPPPAHQASIPRTLWTSGLQQQAPPHY